MPGSVAEQSAWCHTPPVYDDLPTQLFDYHQSMLVDQVRTTAFLKAILQEVRQGDVVLDIGAGSGVLSLFAILAGAEKVYAIEHGPMADIARDIAKRNGVGDRIDIINDWSTAVTLPEQADVLVTETIGNIGFEEGILSWVIDARERLLKPEARIVPGSIAMAATAVESSHDYAEIASLRRPLYGFDFGAIGDLGAHSTLWTFLSPVSLLAEPQTLTSADLHTIEEEDVAGTITVTARRHGVAHGVGCWFDSVIAPGIPLDNAPPTKTPSWNQGFLPLPEPIGVSKGDLLVINIQSSDRCTRWGWSLGVGEPTELEWTTLLNPLRPPPGEATTSS